MCRESEFPPTEEPNDPENCLDILIRIVYNDIDHDTIQF